MKSDLERLNELLAEPPAPRAAVDAAIRKYLMWGVLFITGLAVGYSLAWWM